MGAVRVTSQASGSACVLRLRRQRGGHSSEDGAAGRLLRRRAARVWAERHARCVRRRCGRRGERLRQPGRACDANQFCGYVVRAPACGALAGKDAHLLSVPFASSSLPSLSSSLFFSVGLALLFRQLPTSSCCSALTHSWCMTPLARRTAGSVSESRQWPPFMQPHAPLPPFSGCGRVSPLFSVKFSPFMYSTGFMSIQLCIG